jgi:hypothetical protein
MENEEPVGSVFWEVRVDQGPLYCTSVIAFPILRFCLNSASMASLHD